jgi:hypothetical protein
VVSKYSCQELWACGPYLHVAVNKLNHTTTCKGAHYKPHNHIHAQGRSLIGSLVTMECCKLVLIRKVTHACMCLLLCKQMISSYLYKESLPCHGILYNSSHKIIIIARRIYDCRMHYIVPKRIQIEYNGTIVQISLHVQDNIIVLHM